MSPTTAMEPAVAPGDSPNPSAVVRRRSDHRRLEADVVVIGAGFGGLATALTLAEAGLRPIVCETLPYTGGCAATFERSGYRFEAGATLFAGFGPGQLFDRWIERHRLPVEFERLDPIVHFRAPELALDVPPERDRFADLLTALPAAPVARVRDFLDHQRQLADTLWSLFDDPELLPPLDLRALLRHARRVRRYLPLTRWIGRPLLDLLRHHRLDQWPPLRFYLDAACQITVQTSSARAETPFAVAAIDYYFRGTGHVHGGIGRLAAAMADAIERLGGEVRTTDRVIGLERRGSGWRVTSRTATIDTAAVVANLLPRALQSLLPGGLPSRRLDALAERVEGGWGAAMLYLVLDEDVAPPEPRHLQLVDDPSRPLIAGNHLFCSLGGASESDRAPSGQRTATVSTHVPMEVLRATRDDARGRWVASVQEAMRQTLARRAPEIAGGIVRDWTASPRTFERFTGRPEGLVGGIPRRAGLHNYRELGPRSVGPSLWLAGDSVFPGQSVLAVALGGVRLARRLARDLRPG